MRIFVILCRVLSFYNPFFRVLLGDGVGILSLYQCHSVFRTPPSYYVLFKVSAVIFNFK